MPGRQGEFVYSEESADAVYQPVPVEVQGIIYIYNPPRVQNPGETAGGRAVNLRHSPQAAPGPATCGMPANAAPATGAGLPAANAEPGPARRTDRPRPDRTPTNPSNIAPLRGGRP